MTADIRLLRWPDRDRDDYERLASALARVRTIAAHTRGELTATVPSGPEEPSDLERARMLWAQRRARDAAAGPNADLFGDLAWDIMLLLFIAGEEDRAIDTATVGGLAQLLPQTVERWLTVLESRELLSRTIADSGSRTVRLTDQGLAFMLRCLSAV
ncbi:MAG TPA: hypothetical protein VM900_01310 [Sphingomonas sp.]|nr:hypothetical protein [Sphingomonas sp.]